LSKSLVRLKSALLTHPHKHGRGLVVVLRHSRGSRDKEAQTLCFRVDGRG
jgi:hypothetical protein